MLLRQALYQSLYSLHLTNGATAVPIFLCWCALNQFALDVLNFRMRLDGKPLKLELLAPANGDHRTP
jgi:hypothetical protein